MKISKILFCSISSWKAGMRLERSTLILLVKTTAPHLDHFHDDCSDEEWGFYLSPSSQSTSLSKLFVLALGKNALYRKSEFYEFVDFAVLNLARWTFLSYTCSVFEILAETSPKYSNSIHHFSGSRTMPWVLSSGGSKIKQAKTKFPQFCHLPWSPQRSST